MLFNIYFLQTDDLIKFYGLYILPLLIINKYINYNKNNYLYKNQALLNCVYFYAKNDF